MKKIEYSGIYRLMHWVIALVFVLLLITIFLRSTWMNKYNMAEILQNSLNGNHRNIPQDELIAAAKKIRRPMWKWHIYLGYALVGLFGIRFLLPLTGKMKFQIPWQKNLTGKDKFKRWTYIVFYACVVVSLTTGLMMVWGSHDLKEQVEDLHKLGIYYLLAFIGIHLVGVLWAEFTAQSGIISRIVRGKDDNGEV